MSDRRITPKPFPTVAPAPLPTPEVGDIKPRLGMLRRSVPVSRESTSGAGAYASLRRYFFPTSAKIFNFREGDYYTEKMKGHPAVSRSRQSVSDTLASACRVDCSPSYDAGSQKVEWDLGKLPRWGRVWDGIKTIFGAATWGLFGHDPDYGTIGSFSSKSKVNASNIDCNKGTASAGFSISNRMGLSSNSRTDYDPNKGSNSMLQDDPFGDTGLLGTVQQNWEWKEKITFEANPQCPSREDKDTL